MAPRGFWNLLSTRKLLLCINCCYMYVRMVGGRVEASLGRICTRENVDRILKLIERDEHTWGEKFLNENFLLS